MHLNPGTKHVIVFDSSQVKLTTNENQTCNEDIRYSRRDFQELADRMETMSEEINKLKSEKPFQIVSDHTPKILIDKAGAQDLALIMRTDSMYLAIRYDGALEGHYHNLGAEVIKNIDNYIKDAYAIFHTAEDRINVIAPFESEKGNNGLISIEFDSEKKINNKFDKYNVVVTMMTSKDRYIRNTISKKAIHVDYMKKDLLQVNAQLHEWLSVINNKSSNLKVTQADNKINMQSKRNSELATNRELVAGVIKQLAKNDKENKSLKSYVANIDEITKALDRVDEINLLTFGMKLYKKCARYYI